MSVTGWRKNIIDRKHKKLVSHKFLIEDIFLNVISEKYATYLAEYTHVH